MSEIEEEIRAIMSAFPDLHRGDIASSPSSAVHGRSLDDIVPGDRRRRPRNVATVSPAHGRSPSPRSERRRKPRS
jgi:hypothetical protein